MSDLLLHSNHPLPFLHMDCVRVRVYVRVCSPLSVLNEVFKMFLLSVERSKHKFYHQTWTKVLPYRLFTI